MYLTEQSLNAVNIDDLIKTNSIYFGSITEDSACYNTLYLVKQYLEKTIEYYTKLNDTKLIELYTRTLNSLKNTMELMP